MRLLRCARNDGLMIYLHFRLNQRFLKPTLIVLRQTWI